MVYCIIIFFNPINDVIKRWVHLIDQTPTVSFVIVDNSSANNWDTSLTNCKYLPLFENKGIASAQNEGIRYAMSKGASHIVFFDQDSEINKDYFIALLKEYKRIKAIVPNLAMLGPIVVNKDTMIDYKTGTVANEEGYSLSKRLISSGTIVEVSTLKEVGLMEDKLFIDAVDFECCWRAYSKGYVCARTEKVRLHHKVGQTSKSIMGFPFIVSSPFRYYYQYRNWLWLLRRDYVPNDWKIKISIRKMIELFIIPLLADHKWNTVCCMWRGIKDGLTRR